MRETVHLRVWWTRVRVGTRARKLEVVKGPVEPVRGRTSGSQIEAHQSPGPEAVVCHLVRLRSCSAYDLAPRASVASLACHPAWHGSLRQCHLALAPNSSTVKLLAHVQICAQTSSRLHAAQLGLLSSCIQTTPPATRPYPALRPSAKAAARRATGSCARLCTPQPRGVGLGASPRSTSSVCRSEACGRERQERRVSFAREGGETVSTRAGERKPRGTNARASPCRPHPGPF